MTRFKVLSILLGFFLLSSCGSDLSNQEKRYKYDEFVNKANSLIEDGDYSEAVPYANSAIKLTDTLPNAFKSLGIAFYHQGKLKEARKSFDKVIKIEGDKSRAYWSRALVYLKMNDSDFVDDIDKYLENYEDDQAEQLRRDYFESKNNYTEAIKGYSLVIDRFKDSVELYVKRSELYLQNGDFDEAMSDYDKILSMRPDSPEIESKRISLKNRIHSNTNRNTLIKILIAIFLGYIFISRFILRPLVLKKAENQIGGSHTVGRDPFAWILPFALLITFFVLSHYELIPNF